MKALLPILALLWALSGAGPLRAAERDIRHAFPVQPGCRLKIDSYRGRIEVTESDEPEVKILIHLEIGGETEADARRVLDGLQLDVQARDNAVSIVARNPRETRVRWFWQEDEQIELMYYISVPRQCSVDVKTGTGSITVGRLAGQMAARIEKGNIFFRSVEGSLDASAEFGDIVVSRCLGPLTARVLKGKIRAGTLGGSADLKISSGDVEVMMARGAITARAVAGDLTVGFPRTIRGEARLATSGGSIFASIDPLANCRIEASAVWGRVECRVPGVAGSLSSGNKLAAQLNTGGPLLTMRASGGGVTIESGETLFE